MFFFGVTAALLLTSALIGYGVFVAAHRLRRRWVAAIIGTGCAFALLIAAAIVYLTIGETPANNERVGSEQRFEMWIRAKGVEPPVNPVPPATDSLRREPIPSPSGVRDFLNAPSNKPTTPVIGRIEVRAPISVTSREDFSLALSISYDLQLPTDAYVARLSAPRSAEVRTLDVCATEPDNPFLGCSTPVGNRFQVAWDVTPTEPGQLLFTIGIPPNLTPQSKVDEWEAIALVYGGSGGGPRESPIMSSSSPAGTWRGMSTDMQSGQLRVPVEVVDTLGVSRSVFNALALIGTLLSGLLGSGWLWKLLESWRTRSIAKHSAGAIVG